MLPTPPAAPVTVAGRHMDCITFPLFAALAPVLVGGLRRELAAVHLPGDAFFFALSFPFLPFAQRPDSFMLGFLPFQGFERFFAGRFGGFQLFP